MASCPKSVSNPFPSATSSSSSPPSVSYNLPPSFAHALTSHFAFHRSHHQTNLPLCVRNPSWHFRQRVCITLLSHFSIIADVPSFFAAFNVHSLDTTPWCRSAIPHAYSYMSIYRVSSLSNVGLSRCDATSHTFCLTLEYLSRIIYVLPCAPLYRSHLFSIVMNPDIYQNCTSYNFSIFNFPLPISLTTPYTLSSAEHILICSMFI